MIEVWKSISRLLRLNRHKNQLNQFGLLLKPCVHSPAQPAGRIVEYGQRRHGSCLLHCCKSIGRYWRRRGVERRPAAHATEDEEIEEVHSAQNEQHHPHLHRQRLNSFPRRGQVVTELEVLFFLTEATPAKTYALPIINPIRI